jgi:hypothetical protein
VVPGADAARRRAAEGRSLPEGLAPVYLHHQPGFAFDAALADIARTRDVATARWVAKTLQYPTTNPPLAGAAWPWTLTLRPILLAAAAAIAIVLGVRFLGHRRRGAFRGGDQTAPPATQPILIQPRTVHPSEEGKVMTTPTTVRGPALRRFVGHFLEIVVATVAGMVVLGPVESLLLNPIGWAELLAHFEISALVMATNMTVAMAAWLRFRRHGWAAIAELAAAMYAPFLLLFPPLWLGVLSATGLLVLGHLLLLLAIAAAMLRRREEYTGHHQQARS